ncbi:MAG: glycosyltransferase family 39 protein, partial [Myxococcota bacterium]
MLTHVFGKRWWLLLAIILVGVGVRCYQISDPDITDFHAWRQADTAAFTSGYLVETLNPFYPSVSRYPCDLKGEPFGHVESELPVVAWLAALPLAALDVDVPPPGYLRAISVFFFALACLYLFLLVLRLGGDESEGWLAVAVFCALPLSIFFTRTIQPDGPSLFFGIAFLYHLLVWLEDDQLAHGVLSGVLACLVLLLKLSNGYLGFVALYLFISRKGLVGALKTPKYWVWGFAVLAPVAAWSLHAHEFPWSFGIWGERSGSKFTDWQIFTDPAIWRKLTSRVMFDILTWSGVVLAVVGLTRTQRRELVRFAAVWAGTFVLFVFATLKGNNVHVYYQLPIVVPVSILIGVGLRIVWRGGIAGKATVAALLVIYGVTTYHILLGPKRGWENGYFQDDVSAGIQEASHLVQEHLEPGQKFVSTSRHPALFFNAHRRGYFYEGDNISGFVACTSSEAPYVLFDRGDRKRVESMMRRDERLRGQLIEVEQGLHFSLWSVENASSPVTYLQPAGGSGGRPFMWDCPTGKALRGMQVHTAEDDGVVGALRPVCARVDQDGATESAGRAEGPWRGSHRNEGGPAE